MNTTQDLYDFCNEFEELKQQTEGKVKQMLLQLTPDYQANADKSQIFREHILIFFPNELMPKSSRPETFSSGSRLVWKSTNESVKVISMHNI